MTKLDKPVRREIEVDGKTYTLTIDPLGLKLTPKGHRKGTAIAWSDLVDGNAAIAMAWPTSVRAHAYDNVDAS